MADQEQLYILRQSAKTWNNWRAEHQGQIDLSYADLAGANLSYADLNASLFIGADLSHANLHDINFSAANLSDANLSDTHLEGTNFNLANLGGTNFSGANVGVTNFNLANLSGANFSGATMGWTLLGDRDLRRIKGLESTQHISPSPLSINTIYQSEGDIPEVFLRGIGMPDSFIEYIHALASKPIQYHTCFISYSQRNQDFAERLYADLQNNGVRCWYAPEDLKWGAKTQQGIEQAIQMHDKLLLILSKQSIASGWVEKEVLTAIKKEKREKRTVLFPVRIDNAIDTCPFTWASDIRHERNIGNFIGWKKSHDTYQKAFQRLLRDLKADATHQNE